MVKATASAWLGGSDPPDRITERALRRRHALQLSRGPACGDRQRAHGWGAPTLQIASLNELCGGDMDARSMVVNCIAYRNGERLREEGTFVWLGLHDPDEGLLRETQQEFGLHDLAIEDALTAHQRPKLEEY